MRSLAPVTVLLGLLLSCSAVLAEDAARGPAARNSDGSTGDANSANDPTSPKLTFEYWNFYAPSLYGNGGEAENGLGRILIPFKVDGVQQFLHIIPPVAGNPLATTGPHTGLASTQIYNFTLEKYDVGLPEKVTFGLGPLVAPPTNTSTNFGPSRWQAGVAGVVIAPQSWGLVGVLATYQHTLTGSSSQYTTVQPNIYYNLENDYYLRSSAIMKFNTLNHQDLIPIGIGAGKVVPLDGGYTLNAYVEAQPTVYHTGRGTPAFQLFTGIELQFPSSTTAGLNFTTPWAN